MDEGLDEVKHYIRKIVNLYFKLYTEDSIMEYDTFMKFCRDFNIFPEMCNRPTLHSIFYGLSYFKTENDSISPSKSTKPLPSETKEKVFKSGEYLDNDHFVDALILCALNSKLFIKETNTLQRVLYFMEKILQSKATEHMKRLIGTTRIFSNDIDPMSKLKERYAEFFNRGVGEDYKKILIDKVLEDTE